MRDFVEIVVKDGASWPTAQDRTDAIKITYTAGFGDAASDVPRGLRHALLMTVAHWYESREPVVIGTSVSDLPMAVQALVNRHRVAWYG